METTKAHIEFTRIQVAKRRGKVKDSITGEYPKVDIVKLKVAVVSKSFGNSSVHQRSRYEYLHPYRTWTELKASTLSRGKDLTISEENRLSIQKDTFSGYMINRFKEVRNKLRLTQ